MTMTTDRAPTPAEMRARAAEYRRKADNKSSTFGWAGALREAADFYEALAERDAKAGEGLRQDLVDLSDHCFEAGRRAGLEEAARRVGEEKQHRSDNSAGWAALHTAERVVRALIPEPAPAAPCKHERRSPAASPIPSKSWQCDDCGERFADDAPSAPPADLEASEGLALLPIDASDYDDMVDTGTEALNDGREWGRTVSAAEVWATMVAAFRARGEREGG